MEKVKTEVKTIYEDSSKGLTDVIDTHTLRLYQLENDLIKNQNIVQSQFKEANNSFKDLVDRVEHFERLEREKKERRKTINHIIAGILLAILVVFAIYGGEVLLSGWLS